jgi:hypothetical protein
MGDAPIAYIEGAGGVRIAEDDVVAVGKNDVCGVFSRPSEEDLHSLTIWSRRYSPSRWDELDMRI